MFVVFAIARLCELCQLLKDEISSTVNMILIAAKGPPVQRKPLKHRDYEVDLESRLGKTQVSCSVFSFNDFSLTSLFVFSFNGFNVTSLFLFGWMVSCSLLCKLCGERFTFRIELCGWLY